MVLNDNSYMAIIYENPAYLEYLRYNPRWYKILYYDPSMIDEFIKEAKEKLKLRTVDKLDNFSNRLSMLSQFNNYFNKNKKG